MVVVLAFRRNNWGELVFALGLLFLLEGGVRRRLHALGLLAMLVAVPLATMSPSRLVTRVLSMDPMASGTPEAATNAGHIGDLLDAWDAIKASPILGVGQGKPYATSRIVAWKTESWMVHNAPLHVWVRYGILGLLAFFWWHAAYFRHLDRLRRRWRALRDDDARATSALLLAVLCWSAGVFVIALFFSEWSYSSLQRMVLIGTLWGLTLHRSIRQVPMSRVAIPTTTMTSGRTAAMW
jgi:O-antigen ligase